MPVTMGDFPSLDIRDVPGLITWGVDFGEISASQDNVFYLSNNFPVGPAQIDKITWEMYEWDDPLPYIVEHGSTAEAPVSIPGYGQERFEFYPLRWEEKHPITEQLITGLRQPGTRDQRYGVGYLTRLGSAFRRKDMVMKELMGWLALTENGFEYINNEPGRRAYEKVNYGVNIYSAGAGNYWDDYSLVPTPSGGPALQLQSWLRRVKLHTGWDTRSIRILMNTKTYQTFLEHPEVQDKVPIDRIGWASIDDIKRKFVEFGDFLIFDGTYKMAYRGYTDISVNDGDLGQYIGGANLAAATWIKLERVFGLKIGDRMVLKRNSIPTQLSTEFEIADIDLYTNSVKLYVPTDLEIEGGLATAPATTDYLAGEYHLRGHVTYLKDGAVTLLPPSQINGIPLMTYYPAFWGVRENMQQYNGLTIEFWQDMKEPGKLQWVRMANSGLWAIPFAKYISTYNVFTPAS